jgi:XTP/dITP diphosphohydrolase
MPELLFATRNQGKIEELAALWPGKIRSLLDFPALEDVEETGTSFRENAFLKARAYGKRLALPTLADDSGLEVYALGGAPGVYSARYAGPGATATDNNEKLLQALREVPVNRRGARFCCVLALTTPEGREFAAEGEVEGVILTEPRGSGGFGYDPLFYLPALGKTMSELELAEKNALSHRAKAFAQALSFLQEIMEG